MVVLFLIFFWGTSILISMMAALIYILSNSVERFLFPSSLVVLIIAYFWWKPLFWLEWDGISVILICISFMAKDIKHFIMYLFAICTSFENCILLVLNFWRSLCIFYPVISYKYFLQFYGLSLDSSNCFLC
jgi:hypothetical protein